MRSSNAQLFIKPDNIGRSPTPSAVPRRTSAGVPGVAIGREFQAWLEVISKRLNPSWLYHASQDQFHDRVSNGKGAGRPANAWD
jgi:hypothetical protein